MWRNLGLHRQSVGWFFLEVRFGKTLCVIFSCAFTSLAILFFLLSSLLIVFFSITILSFSFITIVLPLAVLFFVLTTLVCFSFSSYLHCLPNRTIRSRRFRSCFLSCFYFFLNFMIPPAFIPVFLPQCRHSLHLQRLKNLESFTFKVTNSVLNPFTLQAYHLSIHQFTQHRLLEFHQPFPISSKIIMLQRYPSP